MYEPRLIEITPIAHIPRDPTIVPGSKSITNRALVLAALADGPVVLEGALWSEDTQVMVDALRALDLAIEVVHDPLEPCNRRISVAGGRGVFARGGTEGAPRELFVGNAGTAARFLAAMVCLGEGAFRLHGVPRMHERPQADLFRALRQLGYRIDSSNDKLPAIIHGAGARPAECEVSIESSSQFASALYLSARRGQWGVRVRGENADESPYVVMTQRLVEQFPHGGGRFQIEPDASSGSYFWGAGGSVAHWPTSGWQIDADFPKYLPLPHHVSRQADLGDSIMTAIVLAPFAAEPVVFSELGRLRVQECERVAALRTELIRCGARVEEDGDTLTVYPSTLRGAEIETYNDHRMAMCFAMVGLRVPGMRIRNPACVKKTFPNFFAKLAAQPPSGWGVPIFDLSSNQDPRRPLKPDELLFE